jgi:hypothetical protein
MEGLGLINRESIKKQYDMLRSEIRNEIESKYLEHHIMLSKSGYVSHKDYITIKRNNLSP